MIAKKRQKHQNIGVEYLLDIIMPEKCLVCGKGRRSLCAACKREIIEDSSNFCLECGNFITDHCRDCHQPFQKTFAVGFRDEAIGKLAEKLKFSSVRSLAHRIVDILVNVLPDFDSETVIVPVPTATKHIRVRGLDHTKLVAKELAKRKKCQFSPVLRRRDDSVQVGASAKKRSEQAKTAFEIDEKQLQKVWRNAKKSSKGSSCDKNPQILLFDDISTTGSTIKECAKLLKNAGITSVSVVILAKSR